MTRFPLGVWETLLSLSSAAAPVMRGCERYELVIIPGEHLSFRAWTFYVFQCFCWRIEIYIYMDGDYIYINIRLLFFIIHETPTHKGFHHLCGCQHYRRPTGQWRESAELWMNNLLEEAENIPAQSHWEREKKKRAWNNSPDCDHSLSTTAHPHKGHHEDLHSCILSRNYMSGACH